MNVNGLLEIGTLPDLKIKAKPRKLDCNKLRKEALVNILGQSNKDYFILQDSLNHKPTQHTEKDVQAAKNFFKSTYAVLKDFLKA